MYLLFLIRVTGRVCPLCNPVCRLVTRWDKTIKKRIFKKRNVAITSTRGCWWKDAAPCECPAQSCSELDQSELHNLLMAKIKLCPELKNDCPGCGWLQIPATTAPGLPEPTWWTWPSSGSPAASEETGANPIRNAAKTKGAENRLLLDRLTEKRSTEPYISFH